MGIVITRHDWVKLGLTSAGLDNMLTLNFANNIIRIAKSVNLWVQPISAPLTQSYHIHSPLNKKCEDHFILWIGQISEVRYLYRKTIFSSNFSPLNCHNRFGTTPLKYLTRFFPQLSFSTTVLQIFGVHFHSLDNGNEIVQFFYCHLCYKH